MVKATDSVLCTREFESHPRRVSLFSSYLHLSTLVFFSERSSNDDKFALHVFLWLIETGFYKKGCVF